MLILQRTLNGGQNVYHYRHEAEAKHADSLAKHQNDSIMVEKSMS